MTTYFCLYVVISDLLTAKRSTTIIRWSPIEKCNSITIVIVKSICTNNLNIIGCGISCVIWIARV